MTTIKAALNPGTTLEVEHGGDGFKNLIWRANGINTAVATFVTADLLAALDATANTDVKHRADAYEAATRAEDEAAKLRKELSESRKDTRNAELFSETWKARAEKAEAALGRPAELTNNAKASFLWDLAGEVEDQKSPVKRLPKDSETGSVSIGDWLRARALCFPMDGAES